MNGFYQRKLYLRCRFKLEIESLNGEPGVKSARYASETGKSDEQNMAKVLKKLSDLTNRNAQFRTVISLRLNSVEHIFEGVCKGRIATQKSGNEGVRHPLDRPRGPLRHARPG